MEVKEVDICITTFNRNNRLKCILNSLSTQTNMNFNLIINDDGSDELINPNNYPIITKYNWNKNIGYNRVSRFNESILYCVSPKIIILDDDCIPCNEYFIDSHIKELEHVDFSKGQVLFPDGCKAEWFSTANIAFNKNMVKKYGLFFPEYNGHYGYEDLDLGEEIKMNHLRVHDNKNASVFTGNEMYLNGDRSDAIVDRNRSLFKKRWNYV